MRLEIVTVPCLKDNYAYLVHNRETGQTALVDAPEAGPIKTALERRRWTLTDIMITHHHADHIAGVEELRSNTRVIGMVSDIHRLPPLDLAVYPGDWIRVCDESVNLIGVPGHTIGHLAFYFMAANTVFTADSLMGCGCGRLFEGTPEMMWTSLKRLAGLPPETMICSGHEYTANNAQFALTIEPNNIGLQARVLAIRAARDSGLPTVPSILNHELQTNPFLRANLPSVKAAVGMPDATDVEVFAEIRARKDRF